MGLNKPVCKQFTIISLNHQIDGFHIRVTITERTELTESMRNFNQLILNLNKNLLTLM